MPDLGNDGIDVSAEEERYLRRAFRRFALPYLVLALAIAGLAAVAVVQRPAVAVDDSTPAELEAMIAEAASLREAVAAVRGEFREQASRASARLDALEGGMEALTADVKRAVNTPRGNESSSELGSRLDHAHQRINALDRRLKDALDGRFPELDKEPIAAPQPTPPRAEPIAAPRATPPRPEPLANPARTPAWPPASASDPR